MAKTSMGKSNGLHKAYFNGSPAHVGPKPAAPKTQAPQPAYTKAPSGPRGY